ncbi:ImmA/IrrE family metallo-endopeptidase [Terrihalobacillus insolitus]|uniref:ImmA/IrrE family metallo-endopeptidase n=1 Tax=Terrihalobacillus insolitus TaxID=2950438 RepID=UPI00234099A6|nr:ImmA/IrrE family metallo-endopeptidase [Terrihalobacillus insolitus]MDC3414307.1 ImmA/IrrE family metallo-endopeptidase [Terrihalobacillus insolitus]
MYERLQSEALELNIDVQERILKKRIKGLYGDNVIWINKTIETSIEKACVLAEEIGHYHTTIGNILEQSILSNVKQEKLARKWAYKRMIPLEKLIDCFKSGCKSRYEIAEMLKVTEEFLEESLEFYRKKYGTKVKVDDKHILYLSPLAVLENLKGDVKQ